MIKEITRFELEILENDNQHNEVAIQLCKSFGTYKEYSEIKEIRKAHEKKGHIEYSEQKKRDQIIIKYYDLAK